MRLRLRGPSGASTITLGDDATVHDLRSAICEKTSLVRFDVRYSYPPKPLYLGQDSALLSTLDVCLDGEQLTITPNEDPTVRGSIKEDDRRASTPQSTSFPASVRGQQPTGSPSLAGVARLDKSEVPVDHKVKSVAPVSLQRKERDEDVPELALPERGATLVMRVMPDDNSCLFRAFGTAVLPGDDLSMTDLRALVASTIQSEPNVYTEVVLEKKPDDYCRWIQTEQAWGGAIEMNVLSKHFDVEICSIDVQSLRIDRFNEGAPMRCVLVYSGIHYDTIVQSPSEPPHLKADSPPELDKRIWDSDDDEILVKAQELCKMLQAKHYYTDTGGMAIKCNDCGWVGYGERQAAGHAQETGHLDMAELRS